MSRQAAFASQAPRPVGITVLALFFVFGTLASGLTTAMLIVPGTSLDALWRLNPRAHEGFIVADEFKKLLKLYGIEEEYQPSR
ncbi:MAG TPA: hypothetical protein VHA33_17400 [Candidatus Angelobacter sp.]|nr:hypothetical protein [Candidatus Angelobacter sp.]